MINLYYISGSCFFKQKTAYEMRISDWSSDVCSSDLTVRILERALVVIIAQTHERNELAVEQVVTDFAKGRPVLRDRVVVGVDVGRRVEQLVLLRTLPILILGADHPVKRPSSGRGGLQFLTEHFGIKLDGEKS